MKVYELTVMDPDQSIHFFATKAEAEAEGRHLAKQATEHSRYLGSSFQATWVVKVWEPTAWPTTP